MAARTIEDASRHFVIQRPFGLFRVDHIYIYIYIFHPRGGRILERLYYVSVHHKLICNKRSNKMPGCLAHTHTHTHMSCSLVSIMGVKYELFARVNIPGPFR